MESHLQEIVNVGLRVSGKEMQYMHLTKAEQGDNIECFVLDIVLLRKLLISSI